MPRILVAFCLALLTSLALALPASADATVTHINLASFSGCNSYSYYGTTYTYCTDARGEETIVQAASGNWSGQAQAQISSTFAINGTVVQTTSQNVHEHILYADNLTTPKEAGVRVTNVYTYGGVICTYTAAVHFAGGAIQYNNFTYSCV